MDYKKTIILISIFIGTIFLTSFTTKTEQIKPNKPFDQFPLKLGSWIGSKFEMDDRVYNILGVEDYIMADYVNENRDRVSIYVGFYQSQKQGDIIHSPKNCMPGAGWRIIDTSIEPVNIEGEEGPKDVIKLLIQNGSQKQVVLYWFQSRGRIIASEYMQKIWLVVDSITKQRTDGSFVRLISPVLKDEQTTTHIIKDFIRHVYPQLKEHIPS